MHDIVYIKQDIIYIYIYIIISTSYDISDDIAIFMYDIICTNPSWYP